MSESWWELPDPPDAKAKSGDERAVTRRREKLMVNADVKLLVREALDPILIRAELVRTVRFGTASNYVSNPRKTARDPAAFIARHRVNENHGDPLTPGALSRWLLWGESRSRRCCWNCVVVQY